MNQWLAVPSYIFGMASRLRAHGYDRGWLATTEGPCPVISVGNITVGGTGKTPFSIWLLNRLVELKLKPGFVSRGYKSDAVTGVHEVNRADTKAFGDEPVLIRKRFPSLPVYVGRKRTLVVAELAARNKVDIVVADDAFQHRRMQRGLDIVILDALEPAWHYQFLPMGRAREDFRSLARAQCVVISKANLATPEQLQDLEARLKDFSGLRLKMNYDCGGYRKVDEFAADLFGSVFLVTGVGRPESVRRLIRSEIVQHKIFPDHHSYSEKDVAQLLIDFRNSGATYFVTTAKDAVKLMTFPGLQGLIWQMDLKTTVSGDTHELDRQIVRLVRPSLQLDAGS